jgi:hypothetical protein
MGDHQHRAPVGKAVESLLHEELRLGVEGGGGLVEEQHTWLGEQRTRDGEALLLAA